MSAPAVLEAPPPSAHAMFGDRFDLAVRYADLLTGAGIDRGLLGPNEAARLWSRHLLNCAAVADLVPNAARVVDVGSGAGLPGLALAIRRPDLRVDLVEPLQRRVDFLSEAVAALGLADSVQVVRGRAEDARVRAVVEFADRVTARAVAPLERLLTWCLPLVADEGRLLLVKGADAGEEIARSQSTLRRLGAGAARVMTCGDAVLDPPTTVVEVVPHRPDPRPDGRRQRRMGRQG